ncbi:hypothetical protein CEXT_493121 [Caerostris extrusa]|uniref:Maturase K n=1 Tax=Caerostris extrusa TaxID=172846 RepID=A0AAV4RYJ9_CAEEX|nr:hypothetical protein CEXT_493121 [Caerostris extrusa]
MQESLPWPQQKRHLSATENHNDTLHIRHMRGLILSPVSSRLMEGFFEHEFVLSIIDKKRWSLLSFVRFQKLTFFGNPSYSKPINPNL